MKHPGNLDQWLSPAGWSCLGLVLVTLVAFWPAGHLGYIDLDDCGKTGYGVDNPHLQAGITAASVKWAFTTTDSSNWHPLTWISLMLDYQCFGANPAGHHWTNVAWHTLNGLLLLLILRRMTGENWFAALAAALFSIHPLRVESVAWISERKDLLSGFFFVLMLLAWTKHAQSARGCEPERFWKSTFYWLALLAFLFGLMSKPMLVSVPVILLLLDYWPFNRFPTASPRAGFGRLLIEKSPFAALALISCAVTIWAQARGAALISIERLPLGWRLANLPLAYATYLEKIFWPQNLAIFYSYNYTQASLAVFVATVLALAIITGYCLSQRRRPWLWVGWGWFVVMLLPVIGIIQVGAQSIADRYTYLPSIGIAVIVAWTATRIATRSPTTRILTMIGLFLLISLLVVGVRRQLSFWKNSTTLFSRALAVNGENALIRYYLANACRTAGDLEGAAAQYRSIIALTPRSEDVQYRLGYVLMQQRKDEEAIGRFEEVLRLNPKNANAHMGLAYLLGSRQNIAAAEEHLLDAMLLRPGDLEIKASLARLIQQTGSDVVVSNGLGRLKTESTADAHICSAMIALTRNEYAEAGKELESAVTLNPQSPEAVNHLAWLLATCPQASLRDGPRAVELARRACELTPNLRAETLVTLSAALARNSQFEEACSQAQNAETLAINAGENDLVARIELFLTNYRHHQAYTCAN